jgi:hypothetical protein
MSNFVFAEAPQRFSTMEKMDATREFDNNERHVLGMFWFLGSGATRRLYNFIGYHMQCLANFGQINRLLTFDAHPMDLQLYRTLSSGLLCSTSRGLSIRCLS